MDLTPELQAYRSLIHRLRESRVIGDETLEDAILDEMDVAWDAMSAADHKASKLYANEAFPKDNQ